MVVTGHKFHNSGSSYPKDLKTINNNNWPRSFQVKNVKLLTADAQQTMYNEG